MKKTITTLSPEKRVYFHRDPNPDKRQPHSELDIWDPPKDIYSIFSGYDVEDGVAYFKIMINPLVWWVWFGAYVLVLGSMISLCLKNYTMSLISMILLFVYVIVYVFDPILRKKEFDYITKKIDTVKKMFLLKQKMNLI